MTAISWVARMIGPSEPSADLPLLRKEIALDEGHGKVTHAVLHVTAHGIVAATINGMPAGDDVLSPGWSSYPWRLRFSSYDVTDLLAPTVVVGFAIGNGWWRGRLTWLGTRAVYGDRIGALAQLEVRFDDGHVQVVGTDTSWQCGRGQLLEDDLYDGVTIDFRRDPGPWQLPDAPLDGWEPAAELDTDTELLVPYVGPPVRRQEVLRPCRIWTSPSGRKLVDFGQNLVGWLRFEVTGERGSEVLLRHAEVLENDELGDRPLRSAKATDRIVLSGGIDRFEPTTTFHGFRYVEITGWPGELRAEDLEAVVIHSDMRRTGTFACSNDDLNQLHHNIVWGWKGNAVDVPTDCPQRDERLGWTGDLSVFAPTAAFLYDTEDFLRDWLQDLALEQQSSGRVPWVVPDALGRIASVAAPHLLDEQTSRMPVNAPTAIWGDAAVWVPWTVYQAYGNEQVLREQYDSMCTHVRLAASRLSPNGLWDTGFQFGDWLDPTAPAEDHSQGKADRGVVATACLFRSASILSQVARILELQPDEDEFSGLADRLRTAFNDAYVADDRILSDAVTVYALAIVFGLLDNEQEQTAGGRLARLVQEVDHRIVTGFAGTPYVTDALTRTGHLDDAYALLLQTECPSWLYQVRMGATTIWERWDSMLPDGTINPGEMTSFNHYALGAVGDWVHRTVGGLAPLLPGYKRALVAPRPGGGITWAKTHLDSRYGHLGVEWELRDGTLHVQVDVPEGVIAVIDLGDGSAVEVGPGQHHRTAVAA
jgi:alpha-L-rhamnosidase